MEKVIKVEDCGPIVGDYDIPIYNALIIPEGATNGDMILATGMFSVVKELNDGIMVYVKPKGVFGQVVEYTKDWWNAPCKTEREVQDEDRD